MKYMGSKRSLLGGRLGHEILSQARSASTFVDLFSGSGTVSHYVGENSSAKVLAVDQQLYGRALALSVIGRDQSFDASRLTNSWIKSAREVYEDALLPREFDRLGWSDSASMAETRIRCASESSSFIVRDYGGHYFSPFQALALQCLLPSTHAKQDPAYWLKVAVVLRTASRVSASPGHTAQPFQPTKRLIPFIREAWSRDVFDVAQEITENLAPRHSRTVGEAYVGDANEYAKQIPEGSTVFCDPPYSSVQYSRFYHVLEGIAQGGWSSVAGAGRSPSLEARSSSRYSLVTASENAFEELFQALAERSSTVLLTFPAESASNGMTGKRVREIAKEYFRVRGTRIAHTHSTLGGISSNIVGERNSRKQLDELLLIMTHD